jgi:excisionase family DNA binding protein
MTIEEHITTLDRRLLGLEAAAAYLDMTERSIRRLIERGVLQPVQIPTLRRVLLDREDLDRLIEAGKEPAT